MRPDPPPPDIVDRLAAHRKIGRAPRQELEWLAAHGRLRRFEPGEYLGRTGQTIEESGVGLEIVLSGQFSIYIDRGSGRRRVFVWQPGDISGVLPYSRMERAPGDAVMDTPVETLSLPPACLPDLVRECPTVTEICVHQMLDRARAFNTSDWQDEKLASLGKLAAGLAHELNNPASAVARSGALLQRRVAEAGRAARALALAHLTRPQFDALERVHALCLSSPPGQRSPLELADREDAIGGWLLRHGIPETAPEAIAGTAVTFEALDELAAVLPPEAVAAAIEWLAASLDIHGLAAESERAACRISDLVGAMKRLTYLDRAPAPEPTDLGHGLRDTLAILAHKARAKSVGVTLDLPPDVPHVLAIGGELNQVWMNLLDNALDAVPPGGRVEMTVRVEGSHVIVRVIDNGPGIAPEHAHRVFDPFFTTKPPGEGIGLGLETARIRARGQGGDIEFDSRPGRTEFRVLLPRPVGAESAPEAASPPTVPPAVPLR
jgi:signal transduction histidine kinase